MLTRAAWIPLPVLIPVFYRVESSCHHHFCSECHARTAKIGKNSRSFCRQNSYAANAMQKRFSTGTQLGQHTAADDRILGERSNLFYAQPTHYFSVRPT